MFIPLRIRILHLFGRTSFIIGFLFGIVGLAFIVFFSPRINWQMYFAGKKNLVHAEGIITGSQETRYSVNDSPLFDYNYRYSDQSEKKYTGSFLEFEGLYNIGQQIDIEYLINAPGTSRFMGKDRKNLNQIMFLGGMGAVLAGLVFLIPSSRRTRKERRIIMAGLPAEARLVLAEPTNVRVNEQPVYKLTFEFSSGGREPNVCSIRSHLIRNVDSEQTQKLIYDPRKPSNAVIIDTLPSPVASYVLKKLYPSFS